METVSIFHCSACGQDHIELPVTSAAEALIADGVEYDRLVICPTTGRAVYLAKEAARSDSIDHEIAAVVDVLKRDHDRMATEVHCKDWRVIFDYEETE